jgi:predicted AAA+ superfamily ATPase
MQESYLFHFPHIFLFGVKDRSQYPRKCFCGDNGFFGLSTSEVGAGRLWENAVFLRCRAKNTSEISYWKDRSGREVDLVVRDGTSVSQAIQVCSSMADDRTRRREIDALVRCAKELKSQRCLIICDEEWTAEHEGVVIESIPLLDWVMKA